MHTFQIDIFWQESIRVCSEKPMTKIKLPIPHLKIINKSIKIYSTLLRMQKYIGQQDLFNLSNNLLFKTNQLYNIQMKILEHIVAHNKNTNHPISISLQEISTWCFECQSYIKNRLLEKIILKLTQMKFEQQKNHMEYLNHQMENLRIDEMFTYAQFITGLKEKKFQNVCILAGAGMSIAAGIPDFRTPGTELYAQLKKFNLPNPEIIFDLEFFKKKPQVFYQVAKEFLLTFNAKPTQARSLLKWLDSRKQLIMCYTQNIDGLELDAGVSKEKIIQAHGHMRTAHCIECKKEAEIEEFIENIKKDKIHYCKECQKGLIKPDVLFFGEELPKTYFSSIQLLQKSDLVVVIGTNLKVMPFAGLVQHISKATPIVLLNKEQVLSRKKYILHLKEDIELSSQRILIDLQ